MASFPTAVNTAGIAQATAAVGSNYVLPTVDQIFAAGRTIDQIDPKMFFNGTNLDPGAIFPETIVSDLYYNLSFLWPQLEKTGPILIQEGYCTPQICSLLFGTFLYLPNIPANAFFAAIFGLALLITVVPAIRYRTWGFMIGMVLGLLCEVLGYIGRVLISKNDFDSNPFYIYIICLTIGPAFLSFSIYTCLARIVIVYGRNLSRFKPKTYTYIFTTCDFISLVLQGAGGGVASTGSDNSKQKVGINLMIGGLAFQVFSITVFIVACADYALRVYRHGGAENEKEASSYLSFRQSKRFKAFLVALGVATLTIYIRSIFRVAELREGFHSQFASNEVTFLVLEGMMILIATIALTAFHPGFVFGDLWQKATRAMKKPEAELGA